MTPADLAELGEVAREPKSPLTAKRLLRVLTNRDVLLLAVSYTCMCYVFYLLTTWSFLCLVQERHLRALEGGWLAMLPPIGAAVGSWLGGGLGDRLVIRFGARWGYRIVPLVTLPLSGALTLAFAGVESNEGTVMGSDDVGGSRRYDGRGRCAEHRRQPRRRDQHPDHRLDLRPLRVAPGHALDWVSAPSATGV